MSPRFGANARLKTVRSSYRTGMRLSCSTCEIISRLSDGFRDITPQVEAIYIEHLVREHDIEP